MTSDPDSSDRLKKELLAEAKEDLEAWGKRRFWIVLAVFALVGAIGVQAIVQVALKSDIEKMRDDNQKYQTQIWDSSQRQFGDFEQRAGKLTDRMMDSAAKAEAASLRSNEVLEQVRTLQSNTATALRQLEQLKTNVAAVQLDFERTVADAPVLLPEERERIRIKLVPLRSDRTNDSGQVLTRLTYSVDVTDGESQRILNSIERVLYVLSPQWFANNEVERRDPESHFSFSIEVWGVTNVKVHVYLRRGGNPIDFEGRMNLEEVSYLIASRA